MHVDAVTGEALGMRHEGTSALQPCATIDEYLAHLDHSGFHATGHGRDLANPAPTSCISGQMHDDIHPENRTPNKFICALKNLRTL